MMRFTVLLLVGAIFLTAQPTEAQEPELFNPSIKPYGYAATTNTFNGEGYKLKWARIGFLANPTEYLTVNFKYDVSGNFLCMAYGEVHKQVGTVKLSLTTGQFLGPIPFLYPAPFMMQTTRWPTTLDNYSVWPVGIGVSAVSEHLIIRAAHFGDNEIQIAATVFGLSAFWENGVGYGVIAKPPSFGRYVHLSMGYSVEKDDGMCFIQNYTKPIDNLRIYTQVDYDPKKDKVYLLRGVTFEYAPNSFVKLFHDQLSKSAVLEATFYF